ncbi:type I-E CRISPR-associated protein Cse2/CasB [Corynebacterium yudongzhengii]|uniref:Type I-E CRISPR-associated protein Cse2/CasB n=1 Tax=Corynebacterium yudongzhengii TaxID=2080740 RepID=A0A2U1T432_9CORY|nr:type I-E CRISPR-associated protein Cse2/CasB [Corynebacterium yudongzhengii]AWB82408.1 type I-E CRISPR-associated protein Cse2/CasB [Corynebacterium yudongzhengii]PWC00742.1 type I-E CRISPR-associated protein Cse2/CasB [Corynebacterium yudongzhengii]
MTDSSRPLWESRLGYILAQRDKAHTNPAPWRKTRAALRKGNSPHTEHWAYPEVLPYADPTFSDEQKTILIRLFALVAEFDGITQYRATEPSRHRSFGQWAFHVSSALAKAKNESFTPNPDELDAVGQRLQFLHSLDGEEALANVSRIMQLASGLPGPVPAIDFYELFRTFLYWGKGFTPASQQVRRRILRDYFSAFSTPKTESTND